MLHFQKLFIIFCVRCISDSADALNSVQLSCGLLAISDSSSNTPVQHDAALLQPRMENGTVARPGSWQGWKPGRETKRAEEPRSIITSSRCRARIGSGRFLHPLFSFGKSTFHFFSSSSFTPSLQVLRVWYQPAPPPPHPPPVAGNPCRKSVGNPFVPLLSSSVSRPRPHPSLLHRGSAPSSCGFSFSFFFLFSRRLLVYFLHGTFAPESRECESRRL